MDDEAVRILKLLASPIAYFNNVPLEHQLPAAAYTFPGVRILTYGNYVVPQPQPADISAESLWAFAIRVASIRNETQDLMQGYYRAAYLIGADATPFALAVERALLHAGPDEDVFRPAADDDINEITLDADDYDSAESSEPSSSEEEVEDDINHHVLTAEERQLLRTSLGDVEYQRIINMGVLPNEICDRNGIDRGSIHPNYTGPNKAAPKPKRMSKSLRDGRRSCHSMKKIPKRLSMPRLGKRATKAEVLTANKDLETRLIRAYR